MKYDVFIWIETPKKSLWLIEYVLKCDKFECIINENLNEWKESLRHKYYFDACHIYIIMS